MGEIAARARANPEALTLFRRVLLASASLPGVFPPVQIQVVVNGHMREEIHVDGGVTAQVFLAPIQLSLRELDPLHSAPPVHRIYVIRNAKLTPEFKAVEASALALGSRSLSTIIYSQGKSDVLRIYALAQRSAADFNVAAIPASFTQTSKDPFDRDYMRALFALGFEQGRQGHAWIKAPPELAR
jgi:predicted acylesterase/phospholipase RssA